MYSTIADENCDIDVGTQNGDVQKFWKNVPTINRFGKKNSSRICFKNIPKLVSFSETFSGLHASFKKAPISSLEKAAKNRYINYFQQMVVVYIMSISKAGHWMKYSWYHACITF